MPRGVSAMNLLLIWGALGVFVGLWVSFYVEIWQAGDGPAPDLSATGLYVASVLGGVLASFFAVALGIQRKDKDVDARKLRLGATLLGRDPSDPGALAGFATAAFWLYAAVGGWSLATVFFHQVQSPQPIKAMASAFGSVVLALFSGALAPGQTR